MRCAHLCSGSLALASLHLACRVLVPTFPQRSPPLLLTTAACGGLRSAPDCRPRRTFLHLSYSCASPFGPAILVTQDPFRSSAHPKSRTATGAQRAPEWHLAVRPSARDAPSPAAALVPDSKGLHTATKISRRYPHSALTAPNRAPPPPTPTSPPLPPRTTP